jgi:hypothetical protein
MRTTFARALSILLLAFIICGTTVEALGQFKYGRVSASVSHKILSG